MLALLSLFDSPIVRLLAEILAVALLPTVAFLVLRLLGAETRLAQSRQIASDLAADRDRILAELALSRERLAETRQAAGRAQAEAAEREVRLKALADARYELGERRTIVDSFRDVGL
ncbi:hypothetical protein [Caulobacter sp. 602-1]|uniref:hypothetical protein n=1 Tax=Caulobacter sp. 602-1 TaxID=2492472 RepID=UPI000F6351D5|nr:hypothetical protein [Caulobacter sp. 602-1]RRN62000.1 hypothetical protein EIK80_23210 [Caulobacter sp. 602-1]